MTREQWGAKPPSQGMIPNAPSRITVHHTGTAPDPGASLQSKLRSLQNFSQADSKLADGRRKAPWSDVPYHFYIDVYGKVGQGRDVRFVGDTNTPFNPAGHIGVVLEGNFDAKPPTAAQVEALTGLLAKLTQSYRIAPSNIGAHRQFAQTACPGRHLLALLPAIISDVARQQKADG
jgi:hypothetical protein